MGYYCIYQCPKCKKYTFGKCGINYKICPYCNTRFKPETIKMVKGAKEARLKVQALNLAQARIIDFRHKKLPESIFPTSVPVIDESMDGGFFHGEITLIYGPPASGKSLFCFFIASQALNKGYHIVFLDSANTFSVDLVNRFLKDRILLKNFLLFQFLTFEDERNFIKNTLEKIISTQKSILIWDTIVSNIYGTFDVDVNTIILMDEVLPLLRKKLSTYGSMAFFTTNVISSFNNGAFKPIGGHFLRAYSDNVIQLNPSRKSMVLEKVHGVNLLRDPIEILFSPKNLLGE
ncbi:MAG: ATPase domain-containing protein [Candidatus Asgardarchaeia archaeon]